MSTTTEQTSKRIPTKTEQLNYYKDQYEIKSAQLKLQRVVTELSELRAREVEGYAKVAMITHSVNQSSEDERPSGPEKTADEPAAETAPIESDLNK